MHRSDEDHLGTFWRNCAASVFSLLHIGWRLVSYPRVACVAGTSGTSRVMQATTHIGYWELGRHGRVMWSPDCVVYYCAYRGIEDGRGGHHRLL